MYTDVILGLDHEQKRYFSGVSSDRVRHVISKQTQQPYPDINGSLAYSIIRNQWSISKYYISSIGLSDIKLQSIIQQIGQVQTFLKTYYRFSSCLFSFVQVINLDKQSSAYTQQIPINWGYPKRFCSFINTNSIVKTLFNDLSIKKREYNAKSSLFYVPIQYTSNDPI